MGHFDILGNIQLSWSYTGEGYTAGYLHGEVIIMVWLRKI